MTTRPPRKTNGRRDRYRSIDRMANHLDDAVHYIEDRELKAQVVDLLRRIDSLGSTDLLDRIESDLSTLRRRADTDAGLGQYPMRRKHDVSPEEGAEQFPESCEGCPHFGIVCPIFHNPEERKARRRLQQELHDVDHVAIKQAYDRFASRNECHQIVESINAWDEFEGLLSEAWDLYERVEGLVDVAPDDPLTAVDEDVEAALADGGLGVEQ